MHFPHNEAKPTHVSNSSKQNKSVRLLDARPYSSRSNVFNSVTSGPETSQSHTSHNCFSCNEAGHKVYSCQVFLSKNPTERSQLVKANKHCYSCLGAHIFKVCT